MINQNVLKRGSFMLAAELNISHCGKPLTGKTIQDLIRKHILETSDAEIQAESKGKQRSITKMALDANTEASTKANTLRSLANAIESNSKLENYNFLVELGNLIDTLYKDYESAIFNPLINKLYSNINHAVFGCSSLDLLRVRVSRCKVSSTMSVELSAPNEFSLTIEVKMSEVVRVTASVEGEELDINFLSDSAVAELLEKILELVESNNISNLIRLPINMASSSVKQILGSIPNNG
ncbi:hypothetical protein QTV43_000568 [Vibrio vulnificus]|nr:hypothetical protein [Vibrio vulnificus]